MLVLHQNKREWYYHRTPILSGIGLVLCLRSLECVFYVAREIHKKKPEMLHGKYMTWRRGSFLCHGSHYFMPIYDYECDDCHHKVLDVLQRTGEEPLLYCPECNKPTLRKLIGKSSFILKGDGWYAPTKPANDK